MQRILQANWQHHLINTVLRGQFFISPEIALGLGPQINELLKNNKLYTKDIQSLDAIDIKAYVGDEEHDAEEAVQEESRVIVLPVKGTMLKYGTMCTYGMDEIAYYMKHFAQQDDVSAIVIDIDTGGGSVNAVPPLLESIAFARAKGKPVVAHVDASYSAGYWTASACDRVFLNNAVTSGCGSIGVMLSYMDLIPYYEAAGAKYHEIYADPSGDKNSPFRNLLKGDYKQIKEEMLNPLAIQFQNAVKSNRADKLNINTEGLLSGAVFTGQKAIDTGLADQFGTLQEAINYASLQAWANK
ncbi:S49 family peptidase [Sphingobacterium spiritivorum]|uniref:S49 family peptidase n=1 Tax=Sphingobacterium spiritivorum TaxID=258 RepID=UPI003DA3B7CB